jgi:peptidase M24-like protein
MMRTAYVKGIANSQRVAREAVLTVAHGVRPGDTERQVCARLEREFAKARVKHWLHTPYAWWGERTRFDWRGTWETNALPTERVLAEGEAFVLDAAPLVLGFPADFAYSGCATGAPEAALTHRALLAQLAQLKRDILTWCMSDAGVAGLCLTVERSIEAAGSDVIHTRYPAQVLGHTLEGFPNWCSAAPRLGTGFQLPLILTYASGLLLHHLAGTPYPFLNAGAPGRPQGLYALEPHLGVGTHGAKFESVLLVDAGETRWLDPELFGEVTG